MYEENDVKYLTSLRQLNFRFTSTIELESSPNVIKNASFQLNPLCSAFHSLLTDRDDMISSGSRFEKTKIITSGGKISRIFHDSVFKYLLRKFVVD